MADEAAESAFRTGPVLVWDPIGGPTGVAVAEVLAGAGREVHIATPDYIVGNELARAGDLGPANARLGQAGVQLHRRRRSPRYVGEGGSCLGDRFGGPDTDLERRRRGRRRSPTARRGLRAGGSGSCSGTGLPAAGDCVAPRTVHEAVLEGRRRALELG